MMQEALWPKGLQEATSHSNAQDMSKCFMVLWESIGYNEVSDQEGHIYAT